MLRELGVAYSGDRPQGIFVLDQGRLHPLPADPLSLLSSPLLSLADKLELLRVLGSLPRLEAHR
ncbi:MULTISPECIES: hypothetical protein [unclassified Meiothermus]|uniref:hypothetical protein n=1 Tax=unclassified Meiothermus TaxID=370471 RepID=UPI001F3AC998|nr:MULTISPECIES: hypothetical protein [unclassified Meiothermus]